MSFKCWKQKKNLRNVDFLSSLILAQADFCQLKQGQGHEFYWSWGEVLCYLYWTCVFWWQHHKKRPRAVIDWALPPPKNREKGDRIKCHKHTNNIFSFQALFRNWLGSACPFYFGLGNRDGTQRQHRMLVRLQPHGLLLDCRGTPLGSYHCKRKKPRKKINGNIFRYCKRKENSRAILSCNRNQVGAINHFRWLIKNRIPEKKQGKKLFFALRQSKSPSLTKWINFLSRWISYFYSTSCESSWPNLKETIPVKL